MGALKFDFLRKDNFLVYNRVNPPSSNKNKGEHHL